MFFFFRTENLWEFLQHGQGSFDQGWCIFWSNCCKPTTERPLWCYHLVPNVFPFVASRTIWMNVKSIWHNSLRNLNLGQNMALVSIASHSSFWWQTAQRDVQIKTGILQQCLWHKDSFLQTPVQQSGRWLSFSHHLWLLHSLLCGFGPHGGLHSSAGQALSAHAAPVLIQVWSAAFPLLYAGLKSLFVLVLLCDAKSVLFLHIKYQEQQELPASCSADVLFSLAVCTGL